MKRRSMLMLTLVLATALPLAGQEEPAPQAHEGPVPAAATDQHENPLCSDQEHVYTLRIVFRGLIGLHTTDAENQPDQGMFPEKLWAFLVNGEMTPTDPKKIPLQEGERGKHLPEMNVDPASICSGVPDDMNSSDGATFDLNGFQVSINEDRSNILYRCPVGDHCIQIPRTKVEVSEPCPPWQHCPCITEPCDCSEFDSSGGFGCTCTHCPSEAQQARDFRWTGAMLPLIESVPGGSYGHAAMDGELFSSTYNDEDQLITARLLFSSGQLMTEDFVVIPESSNSRSCDDGPCGVADHGSGRAHTRARLYSGMFKPLMARAAGVVLELSVRGPVTFSRSSLNGEGAVENITLAPSDPNSPLQVQIVNRSDRHQPEEKIAKRFGQKALDELKQRKSEGWHPGFFRLYYNLLDDPKALSRLNGSRPLPRPECTNCGSILYTQTCTATCTPNTFP